MLDSTATVIMIKTL